MDFLERSVRQYLSSDNDISIKMTVLSKTPSFNVLIHSTEYTLHLFDNKLYTAIMALTLSSQGYLAPRATHTKSSLIPLFLFMHTSYVF